MNEKLWVKTYTGGKPNYCTPEETRDNSSWVGLTDEEKQYLNEVLNLQGRFPIIDAIEAKLKEKNNG